MTFHYWPEDASFFIWRARKKLVKILRTGFSSIRMMRQSGPESGQDYVHRVVQITCGESSWNFQAGSLLRESLIIEPSCILYSVK